MTTPARDTASKYDQILAGLNELSQSASEDNARLARMEEKMTNLDTKVARVEKALYGNGDPGMVQSVWSYGKRIEDIEEIEAKCEIKSIAPLMLEIKRKQEEQEKAEEKKKEAVEVRDAEQRKFRYGLYTAIVISIFDIIARLLNII